MEKKVNLKLRNAILRALAAVAAAVILLAVTNFAFIKLLGGSDAVSDISSSKKGDYVSTDVSLILDFYAEAYRSDGGDATSLYAVTVSDTEFYTVLLPSRYFDSAKAINGDTQNYMLGSLAELSRYFVVTGTVAELSASELTYFYDWFTDNLEWLQSSGVVDEVADYANYISPYVLRVDYVGSAPVVEVYILSSLAWLCLIYAIIVCIRWALGKYDDAIPVLASARPAEAADAQDPAPAAEETDADLPSENAEAPLEAGEDEETDEDGDAEITEEKIEETEDGDTDES